MRVKKERGITDLPGSFIEYALESVFQVDLSATLVSASTLVVFLIVATLSVYKLFIKGK